jgi:dolichol-phosphate mannosyltransferase
MTPSSAQPTTFETENMSAEVGSPHCNPSPNPSPVRGVDVGLCIPVLNERAALPRLFDEIESRLAGSRYTICIVDDGSTDGTLALVEERCRTDEHIMLLKRRKERPGCRRGGASRAGLIWLLANTSHAYYADVDGDGQHRTEEIVRAIAIAQSNSADVVIASKYTPGSRVTGRPLVRRAGSRVYNLLLRALMDWRIRDYSNSFRIYRRSAAEVVLSVEPLYDTPVYLVEMLAIWISRGLRIIEMPTINHERHTGTSKVVPGDFLRGAAGALRVGLAYRSGHFRSRP